jgi:hypothetical protein
VRRRDFLAGGAGALVGLAKTPPCTLLDQYFLEIAQGFLTNARKTSPSFAVCDFPDGTILQGAVGRSGKTYDSVSRMLPALAAWVAGGRQPGRFQIDGKPVELLEVLSRTFVNAFDPASSDYWEASPAERQNQRQVESGIVAWSLWLLRDRLLPRLSSAQRANIQAWLVSCTRVPVRRNNWAWFTAVNHAVRLALSERWKEFSGDAAWMIEDLKVLEAMAAPGDGWYTDSLAKPTYDYYNFWVFASHFLYWNRVIGSRYPEWAARFRQRLRLFLEKAPYFFGGNGSHVLFGRSLIYRWAVLTPLVLAYEQKLWPHSPGLLRRIVRRNLEFLWSLGAFDRERGKLRETFSRDGTPDIHETYIDNGHPYWGMQAFAFFLIPKQDPFWTAPEEPLPVQRDDFRVPFQGTRMLLVGTKRSGQVQWLQALNANDNAGYQDKYNKFAYSSHFPFNILKHKDRCAFDSALIFRNPQTGACAGRTGLKRGELTPDGVEIEWWSQLGDLRFDVTSRIRVVDEFQQRTHRVKLPLAGIQILDGSYPLGLLEGEDYLPERAGGSLWLRAARSGSLIASWNLAGYESIQATESFDETGRRNVNIIYPRMVVTTLRATGQAGEMVLKSLHYASPSPLAKADITARARSLQQ